jgi:Leucine-rich repeat (LRR) protein
VERLPECIGKLENLIELDVEENRLKELPPSFEKLKKLKNLYVQNNFLSKEQIPQLPSLEFCDLLV